MQALTRPRPGLVSAQTFFTSSAQALTVTALSTTFRQGSDRSLRCVLTQSLIRPSPGFTPGHCALTSLTQALTTPLSCADAVVHGSSIARTRKIGLTIERRVVI